MNMNPFSLKRKFQSPCDKQIVQFMWERCIPQKFCKFIYQKNLFVHLILERSSLREVFCKKGVLKNFSNFTGKHLCQSVIFNKVAGPRRFPVNFAKHLLLTVSTLIRWTEVEKVLIPYLTNLETFNELSRLFLKYKLVYHYVYCTLFG